ncbi:Caspase-3 [Bulinus truncatus]|nr:Caspase-3 [Bulinus truncatus]
MTYLDFLRVCKEILGQLGDTDIKNSASPNPSHSPSYKAPCVSPAPCFKDFLVMYATPPGYYAFRRIKDGSWFITSLCKVLKEHVNSPENLLTILTKVVKHVAQEMKSITSDENLNAKKQTPVIYSRLTKNIFLNKKT